ncbi:MAG: type II secretion system minor pseudopilin GspK [Myxococcota bacterium]
MRLRTRDRRRGVVLALVLTLALVLSAAIITFVRRSIVDSMIVRNRDAVAQAEALARGGVRLATALVLEDLLAEAVRDAGDDTETPPGDTLQDLWARLGDEEISTADGALLRVRVEDAGALLNLNGLIDFANPENATDEETELFLADVFRKVIEEIPLPPGEKLYDPRELAENLIDFIDPNQIRIGGGAEDDYYQRQDPPYRAANRPLLGVDELRMVEGFDEPLVEALRPYVTVYPLVGGGGINLNTAPPHVLASLYHGASGSRRLADEGIVRELLRARAAGDILCDDGASDERCRTVSSVGFEGTPYPASPLPASADVFRVTSQATVGEIHRSIEAVVDRSVPSEPRLLSWRVH